MSSFPRRSKDPVGPEVQVQKLVHQVRGHLTDLDFVGSATKEADAMLAPMNPRPVMLAEHTPHLGVPDLVAVISAEGLNKDLTGFDIVQDQAYTNPLAWLAWLTGQAKSLREELLQNLDSVPIRDTVSQRLDP